MSKPIVRTFVCDEIRQKRVPPEVRTLEGGARVKSHLIAFEQVVTLIDELSDSRLELRYRQFDDIDFAPGRRYELTIAEQPKRALLDGATTEAPATS